MKKRKPYYIIIAVLCLASVISIFLPYLVLPSEVVKEDGYILDLEKAAIESDMVPDLAMKLNEDKDVVYDIAKAIIKDKDPAVIADSLNADEAYIIDITASEIDRKVAELKNIESFKETRYSFFSMIKMSAIAIKDLQQDVVDAGLVIFTMISTILLAMIAGVYILIAKGKKKYRFVQWISFSNIILSGIGLLSINSVSIGALQVEVFHKENWGIGFFIVIYLNLLIWLISTIGAVHEKMEGFITWKIIFKQKQLIFMTIPFIIYATVFSYAPLMGWTMAFQRYKPALKSNQAWIAWDKFKFLFTNVDFLNVFRNTIAMSVINLILSFVFSIGFALLLNEVISLKGKKFVQTVSYLPHFLSWIIVTGIVSDVLSMETGVINQVLVNLHLIGSPINFFAHTKYFWSIVGFSNVWKETGWGSIIYLAAITSINPDLYEAAAIDGAGRWKKMLHITLPSIKPTIFILLILNIGWIMNAGFEVQYILGSGLIQDVSQTIDIYVLKYGINVSDYSLGTAAGIFKSVVSIILIFLANRTAKAVGEERLF